jgi:hypothetical protein
MVVYYGVGVSYDHIGTSWSYRPVVYISGTHIEVLETCGAVPVGGVCSRGGIWERDVLILILLGIGMLTSLDR